jgi:hypothetical protein
VRAALGAAARRAAEEPRRAPLLLTLFLASAIAGLPACGKKGDPQAPVPRGPRAASDLAVEQEGLSALLAFSYPDRLLTGEPLTDLEAIEIYRAVDPSPAITTPRKPPSGALPGDEAPGSAERRAAQSVRLAEQAFLAEAALLERLTIPALARRTQGASLRYEDSLGALLQGRTPPGAVAWAVISQRRNGERSPLSNIAVLSPAVPPAAPAGLRATPEAGKVSIAWSPVETDVAGKELTPGGYRVYRRILPAEEYGAPLNPEPVTETSFADASAPYGELAYTVRAAHPEKKQVEGLPAEEVFVTYRDVFPPAAPARVDVLPEGNLVRVLWDPVTAPDLAGYLVFRAEGSGAAVPLTPDPIVDTVFTDESARPRVRYRYSVVAVDAAGNRSPPSPEAIAEPF